MRAGEVVDDWWWMVDNKSTKRGLFEGVGITRISVFLGRKRCFQRQKTMYSAAENDLFTNRKYYILPLDSHETYSQDAVSVFIQLLQNAESPCGWSSRRPNRNLPR